MSLTRKIVKSSRDSFACNHQRLSLPPWSNDYDIHRYYDRREAETELQEKYRNQQEDY